MWKLSPSYQSRLNRWHLHKQMPWNHGDRFTVVAMVGDDMKDYIEFRCRVQDTGHSYVLRAMEPFTAKFNYIPDLLHLFHGIDVMGTYIVPPQARGLKNFNLEISKLLEIQKINMKLTTH